MHRCTNIERESSSTSTPTKPRSRLTLAKLQPAQPSSDHASPLPKSRAGQTPKTHKHQSTQISAHPSLITDPPLRSPAMHRQAPILTIDRRPCSTRLSNALAATTNHRSGRHRLPAHSTPLHPQTHPIWPLPPPSTPILSFPISLSLNLSLFLPPLTEFVNKVCFCFDFCFLCCLYILILCNNICLDLKKMWETW